MEDITLRNPRQIGTHVGWISTVLFDSLTQSLLVGDFDGHLKQYKKVNQSFTIVKDYGELDVGCVLSSTQVGRFAIFGGNDRSLVAIDISKQRVFPGRLKSPFKNAYSLQVCQGIGSNVYLSLGGSSPEYSSDAFDFLDVTLFCNPQKTKSPNLRQKMNQADSALREKDQIIISLNLKIKKLESSLQKQADQNKGKSNLKISKTKSSRFKSKINYYNPRTRRYPEIFRKSQKMCSPSATNSIKSRTNYKIKNLKMKVGVIIEIRNQNNSLQKQNEILLSESKKMSKNLQEKSKIILSQKSKIEQIEKELQSQKSQNESKNKQRHSKPK